VSQGFAQVQVLNPAKVRTLQPALMTWLVLRHRQAPH